MTTDQLHKLLAQLRFHGMARALDVELERAEREATPAAELIYRLLSAEAAYRRERSLAYRLDQARLPWRWTLESFPFERQPGLNKSHILTLAGLDFLRRAENVLLIGEPGTGKTTASSSASTARHYAAQNLRRRRPYQLRTQPPLNLRLAGLLPRDSPTIIGDHPAHRAAGTALLVYSNRYPTHNRTALRTTYNCALAGSIPLSISGSVLMSAETFRSSGTEPCR